MKIDNLKQKGKQMIRILKKYHCPTCLKSSGETMTVIKKGSEYYLETLKCNHCNWVGKWYNMKTREETYR